MEKKYSGKKVERAGKAFRNIKKLVEDNEKFNEAMDILSYWRFSHDEALDSALSVLRKIVIKKDKHAFFAKRLKRSNSIITKLERFDDMSLKTMQDIGGCRAILVNEKKLRQSVRELRKLKNLKTSNGSYRFKDYIKLPKEDGYRSYHIVGKFQDEHGNSKNIEIQLRTRIQHYWATALEIVDLFTNQALKSNQGDPVWKSFFFHISNQFAVMDGIHIFENMDDRKRLQMYLYEIKKNEELLFSCVEAKKFIKKLKVIKKLSAFAGSLKVVEERLDEIPQTSYALLKIDTIEMVLTTILFSKDENKDAENKYIEEEKEAAKKDNLVVALVSSSAVGGIKEAYPNYFADSSEFMRYMGLIEKVQI